MKHNACKRIKHGINTVALWNLSEQGSYSLSWCTCRLYALKSKGRAWTRIERIQLRLFLTIKWNAYLYLEIWSGSNLFTLKRTRLSNMWGSGFPGLRRKLGGRLENRIWIRDLNISNGITGQHLVEFVNLFPALLLDVNLQLGTIDHVTWKLKLMSSTQWPPLVGPN